MKPGNNLLCCIFFAGLLSLAGVACKKKKAFKQEDGQSSVDVRNTQAECDVALKDINEALSGQWLLRGRSAMAESTSALFGDVCGLTVDTSAATQGVITLNYDGSPCSGRRREGSIRLTLQNYPLTRLKTPGSSIMIDFTGYKITKAAYGNSLQFDGTAFLKNESGGTWYDLIFLNLPTLVQSFNAGDLKANLGGDNTLLYTISRRNTYTYTNKLLRCVMEGTGSHDGKNNIENFGATRSRDNFTSEITTPVVWTSVCGPIYPIQGALNVKTENKPFELQCTYGTDAQGNAYTENGCPYGWKISWSYKKDTRTRVFGYDN